MAENSAHLAANLQSKPSIFEVVAAESLAGTFYPAFRRITQFLVLRNPETFAFVLRHYDEIFFLANGVIQSYYLKNRGGTLAEVFYGLRRFSTGSNDFSRKDRILALLFSVIFPYVKIKADKRINQWKEALRDGDWMPRAGLKQLIIKIHGVSIGVHECLKIVQYIAYLSGNSQSHTPLFRAINQGLTYIQGDDEETEWTWRNLLRGHLKMSTILSEVILKSLEFSAFFIQFLQWWQTEAQHTDLTSLPTPSFPVLTRDLNYQNVCPVCLGKWNRPACCALSGYIYCYKCIVTAIERTGVCPASNYPISIEDIFLVYDD
ncbi:peroxisome assembly protein 12 [Phlebotomus argentipes]|uniref:peroxisome assembly protein 12 n=1 Tax=Phlebotomus argentipes TaxID=94469 RepID=UPI002893491B|nr:peroxisome assembly protein 12 [Phlebotomus argentipes]